MSTSILVGGDVCPIRRNLPYFHSGDANNIFNDLLVEFEEADLKIVNMECPLIKEESPIIKCGPVLGVDITSVNGIKASHINMLNLANNHILDHGWKGLESTINTCNEAGIITVGAGKDIASARKIIIQEVNNIRIAFLGIAEHEFSIAKENAWGANPLDMIDYVRNVQGHKADFDYLIVLLHGGNEGYPYPSPRLMETCHFMVEMGANAVICQHSHCVGCYEKYNGGYIVYGQGNLIFDYPNHDRVWNEGFLVKLAISNDGDLSMDIIPYLQSDSKAGARRMNEADSEIMHKLVSERSNAILDSDFVGKQWSKFCEERRNFYMSSLLGHKRILHRLNRSGHIVKYFYSSKHLACLGNLIRCEAHKEILDFIFD